MCRQDRASSGQAGGPMSPVAAQLLHWAVSANAAQLASAVAQHTAHDLSEHAEHTDGNTSQAQRYSAVVASDCLFFRDFHRDLLLTLRALLAEDGVALLLQPARDGTLQLFVDLCAQTGMFSSEVVEDYNPQVVQWRLFVLLLDNLVCLCVVLLSTLRYAL